MVREPGDELLYRRNRLCDPQTGRFTQEDPIGLAGGLNLYGFGGGDPVNYADPFGLCGPLTAICIAVTAALEDLRAWHSDGHPEDSASFEAYLQQNYGSVVCGEVEGRRITVMWSQSLERGGGAWYEIDADSFEMVGRVFGR